MCAWVNQRFVDAACRYTHLPVKSRGDCDICWTREPSNSSCDSGIPVHQYSSVGGGGGGDLILCWEPSESSVLGLGRRVGTGRRCARQRATSSVGRASRAASADCDRNSVGRKACAESSVGVARVQAREVSVNASLPVWEGASLSHVCCVGPPARNAPRLLGLPSTTTMSRTLLYVRPALTPRFAAHAATPTPCAYARRQHQRRARRGDGVGRRRG